MHVNATSALAIRDVGRGMAVIAILALGVVLLSWVAQNGDDGPHSVTIVGVSQPGTGTGLYNGLRAKSVPAITDVSRLEEGSPGAHLYSFVETDSIQ
jgi:hypothetical protein